MKGRCGAGENEGCFQETGNSDRGTLREKGILQQTHRHTHSILLLSWMERERTSNLQATKPKQHKTAVPSELLDIKIQSF